VKNNVRIKIQRQNYLATIKILLMSEKIAIATKFSVLRFDGQRFEPVATKIQSISLISRKRDEQQTKGQSGGSKLQEMQGTV
jgi:hypothetical protein